MDFFIGPPYYFRLSKTKTLDFFRNMDKIWKFLGWINSKLILTIVYLLVLIPISIFMKISDMILYEKENNLESYKKLTATSDRS